MTDGILSALLVSLDVVVGGGVVDVPGHHAVPLLEEGEVPVVVEVEVVSFASELVLKFQLMRTSSFLWVIQVLSCGSEALGLGGGAQPG